MVEPRPSQTLLETQPRIQHNNSRRLYLQWRVAELLASVFSCFGLISASADYEFGFSQNRTHSNCAENVDQFYRWITMVFTVVSMYFLALRHWAKLKWNSNRGEMSGQNRIKNKTRPLVPKRLAIELAVLAVFPYPYLIGNIRIMQPLGKSSADDSNQALELCYNLSEFLYVFMFLRLLFLFRALFNFTPYQDDHAKYYCEKKSTKANVRFSIRCMMKTHPFLIIYCFSLPSFFLLGAFLRVFERPFADVSGQNYASYQNAVWNCAVTMSTVGYGDLFPGTIFGRIVGVLCSMWGAFVFSMIVFTFQSLLELDHNQSDAFLSIKETRAAARVVTASLIYAVVKKKKGASSSEAKKQMRIIESKLSRYQATMKKLKKINLVSEVENPANRIRLLSQQIAALDEKISKLFPVRT